MPQTIRLEFAKSNTKVSKPKQPAAAAATSHPALMHPLTGRKYAPPLVHSLDTSHYYSHPLHRTTTYLPPCCFSLYYLSIYTYLSRGTYFFFIFWFVLSSLTFLFTTPHESPSFNPFWHSSITRRHRAARGSAINCWDFKIRGIITITEVDGILYYGNVTAN